MNYQLHPLGDQAIIIDFGNEINEVTHQSVQTVATLLDEHPPEWMIEYIPAFTTVTLFYNLMKIPLHSKSTFPYSIICEKIKILLSNIPSIKQSKPRIVEIPVCYGGEFGPDLEEVAKYNRLTTEEVMTLHANGEYLVYMIGFAPGFPYIGGMNKRIATPRKATPRLKIPEGSVGIAGNQTGVYPIETPGGWQLIGKTPLKLFRPYEENPSLLMAGDQIKFKPITLEEYMEMEAT
ncbi:inhibitor of KinA [Bacillus pakistanensis]|uniref:Inhibitor of KinA n=1 Tax=Rossellomorea pakistanensis TaxID=992288 RepID=A0ABS2NIN3_9BACI|nr:5-oxoprolinase subunit PxpB [Bacillus pakistanensis]MBM7587730.1 inhibitor of KinA [Bacillus pakistanensis]